MKFIDLHEDFAFSAQNGKDVISEAEQSNIHELSKMDNVVVFSSIFSHIYTKNERENILTKNYGSPSHSTVPLFDVLKEQIKFYLFLERRGHVKIIRKKEDIIMHGVKFLLSLEGTDCLNDPYDLYLLKDLHVFSIGLAWNYDTKFAASCMSKKDYGLTADGEELIKIANELGIIIDVAHSSKNTIIDVSNVSKHPIIASHTNVKSLKDHVRNLDDEEIEAIVKTGGIIGVTAIVSTLPKKNIDGIIENIKYIGENFGWEHVAIGTDFLGIREVPEEFENITKIKVLYDLLGEHAEDVLWNNAKRVIDSIIK
ncbi:MAG: dipeptidase [Thermoprotei archaeon]